MISFFSDPRDWLQRDIRNWLSFISAKFSLKGINAKRFPDNGRDLCKLSR